MTINAPVETPMIYDGALDERRPATQGDIDRLQDVAWCYFYVRNMLNILVKATEPGGDWTQKRKELHNMEQRLGGLP